MEKEITNEMLKEMLKKGEISKEMYDEFTDGKGGK